MHAVARFLWPALVTALFAPATVSARPASVTSPQGTQAFDDQRRLDINQLNMWVTNYGSIAWARGTGDRRSYADPGLEYPKGSGNTAMFAAGLWLGAKVAGETRAVVAEYSQEYGPGPMVGGTYADPSLPQYRVYKVLAWSGNPADTGHVDRVAPGPMEDPLAHHSWSEYMAGAVPDGAPWQVWDLPDPNNAGLTVPVPGPAIASGQLLWCVYNDADPALHTNEAGNSAPLGIEVQQMVIGATASMAESHAARIRYRIINKGAQQLDEMYVSMWSDPDLGNPSDDLIGSSDSLDMVYAYNSNNADTQYGAATPAVGFVLLEGPKAVLGDTIPAASAVKFIGGLDPVSAAQSYYSMLGLFISGDPMIDPTTGLPTTFWVGGDPIEGTGWLDSNPADRRTMISSGPFAMAPGDTQEVEFALVVGQGPDRLASIHALRANAYELIYGVPAPMTPAPTNCPRPREYWTAQCPPGVGDLTAVQIAAIAQQVGARSLLFDWPNGTESSALCTALGPSDPTDLRAAAKAEYAALMANWSAGQLGIVPPDGQPIRLLGAGNVSNLVEMAGADPTVTVTYADDVTQNPRALTGVNWGGAAFFGGAGYGWNFWGGSLNPAATPDSFPTLEIRFNQGATQKAYRYLRLEQANGSAPSLGREYRYGGFREVPFQVWDTEHNVQLDVAFVERAITDAAGTIQPPAAQPATFDSTWAPDASEIGGREYLFTLHTPYSPVPKTPFEVDDAMDVAPMPILYGLWARLRGVWAVIDDGDRMVFASQPYSGSGVDTQLLRLERKPLSDPATQAAYSELLHTLETINGNLTLESPCDTSATVEIAFVGVQASMDSVVIVWQSSVPWFPVNVVRLNPGGSYLQTRADANGEVRFVDRTPVPGDVNSYQVVWQVHDVRRFSPAVNVRVPTTLRPALEGFIPNPARTQATIAFFLPMRAPARLELLDLQGRRVWSREVGDLGPGRWTAMIGGGVLRPGVYLIHLRQAGMSVSRKAVFLR